MFNAFREFVNRKPKDSKVEEADEKERELLETYPEFKDCPSREESQRIIKVLMDSRADVQVKGDGGIIEDGWKIISMDGELTLARKEEKNKTSEWRYRTRELAKWNKDRILSK